MPLPPLMQPKKKQPDPDAEARQMMLDKSMVPAATVAKTEAPPPLANGANGLTKAGDVDPMTGATTPPRGGGTNTTGGAGVTTTQQTTAANAAATAAAKAAAIEQAKRKARAAAEDKARANVAAEAEANAVHSTDDVDEAARRLFYKQIQDAMNPDTSADEALATQQADALRGADVVNQRARAGRAGFGSSGAQMAMESDIERASRMGLTDKVLGIRNDAKQRGIDNALASIGADVDLREAGSNAAINAKLLELLGIDDPNAAGEGGEGGAGLPGLGDGGLPTADDALAATNAGIANGGVETDKAELASSGRTTGTTKNPTVVTTPPEGGRSMGHSASLKGTMYFVPNGSGGGTYFIVKD